jgi:hypothetical protein
MPWPAAIHLQRYGPKVLAARICEHCFAFLMKGCVTLKCLFLRAVPTESCSNNLARMRLNHPPEHDCPVCEEHPSLVYESSVGPLQVGRAAEDTDNVVSLHFFLCAMCGRRYCAVGPDGPLASFRNQDRRPFEKQCFACGDAMKVEKIAGSPKLRGPYHRVETTLGWQCFKCGATEQFHHADVLGFE